MAIHGQGRYAPPKYHTNAAYDIAIQQTLKHIAYHIMYQSIQWQISTIIASYEKNSETAHVNGFVALKRKNPEGCFGGGNWKKAATCGHLQPLAATRENQPLAATVWVLSINFKPCTCCGEKRPLAATRGPWPLYMLEKKRMLMKKKVNQKADAH